MMLRKALEAHRGETIAAVQARLGLTTAEQSAVYAQRIMKLEAALRQIADQKVVPIGGGDARPSRSALIAIAALKP